MPAQLFSPPPLGVGLLWSPRLTGMIQAGSLSAEVLAIAPQPLWQRGAAGAPHTLIESAVEALRALPTPKLLRGAGLPLATSAELCRRQAVPWRQTIERLQPAWVSENLAFTCAQGLTAAGSSAYAGATLPPLQCAATVLAAVRRIESLRRLSHVPVAFRIVANHLSPQAGEMPDGEFYAAVADASGCGIVLDLDALWSNECSGRAKVADVLARLPLHRVWEVQVARGEGPGQGVPPAVMALLAQWLPAMPQLGALILDPRPEPGSAALPSAEALAAQMTALRALWPKPLTTPLPSRRASPRPQPAHPIGPACTVDVWERALCSVVNGHDLPAGSRSLRNLLADPGVHVYRRQIESSRAGMLIECLPLTWRALVLQLGLAAAEALRQDFSRGYWPQAFAQDEARNFAHFLHLAEAAGQVAVPHLRSVLEFEMACADGGIETQVHFDGEPLLLLAALSRGEWPPGVSEPLPKPYHNPQPRTHAVA